MEPRGKNAALFFSKHLGYRYLLELVYPTHYPQELAIHTQREEIQHLNVIN